MPEYPCICEMDSNLNSQHLATLLLQLKSKRAAANDGIWHGTSLQTACYQLCGGHCESVYLSTTSNQPTLVLLPHVKHVTRSHTAGDKWTFRGDLISLCRSVLSPDDFW